MCKSCRISKRRPPLHPPPPTTIANPHIDRSLASKETHIQSHNRYIYPLQLSLIAVYNIYNIHNTVQCLPFISAHRAGGLSAVSRMKKVLGGPMFWPYLHPATCHVHPERSSRYRPNSTYRGRWPKSRSTSSVGR